MERSVEIVRHAAFVSRQSFETLDAAQNWLDRILHKINSTSGITGISDSQKQERIRADLYCLQPAPQPMGCFEAEEHTPDSYGTINVDYNNYSVPEGLVGSSVLARVYSGHIAIYHQGRRVADHVRLEGKGGWSMQLEHYLGTFLRKPGALDNSTAMRQVPAELAEALPDPLLSRSAEGVYPVHDVCARPRHHAVPDYSRCTQPAPQRCQTHDRRPSQSGT